jgi:hypothetical protein
MNEPLPHHKNYNCKITTQDGQEHLVYANWIHNQGLDYWKGWNCSAGKTMFYIDKNFDIWSGQCQNDHLGNILSEWSLKTDTVCNRERCMGCTDTLSVQKSINE